MLNSKIYLFVISYKMVLEKKRIFKKKNKNID